MTVKMAVEKFKRAIVSTLQRVSERCEAWEKALDAKSIELQARFDNWYKRMDEKIDKWGT